MEIPESVRQLERDLRGIFGPRLSSLAMYGLSSESHSAKGDVHGHPHSRTHNKTLTHTLAVVDGLSGADLKACASRVVAWHEAGVATPLLVGAQEFSASLDAFPLEFGAMIADHIVVSGKSAFEGLAVDPADLRRAIEVQARGHLLHLRQGYVETRGRSDALSVLIVNSAPALSALLLSVARLDGRADGDVAGAARHAERTLGVGSSILAEVVALAGVGEITSADADRLFAPYLDAVEKLVLHVDSWRQ